MAALPPAVTARVMRGAQLSMILGQLIYEGSQPYMQLIDPTSGELLDARIALDAQRLKLIEEEQAGRPALYYCRDILVHPQP
jgi:hypothetical protein